MNVIMRVYECASVCFDMAVCSNLATRKLYANSWIEMLEKNKNIV